MLFVARGTEVVFFHLRSDRPRPVFYSLFSVSRFLFSVSCPRPCYTLDELALVVRLWNNYFRPVVEPCEESGRRASKTFFFFFFLFPTKLQCSFTFCSSSVMTCTSYSFLFFKLHFYQFLQNFSIFLPFSFFIIIL